jgi:DNA-binding protein H-NS
MSKLIDIQTQIEKLQKQAKEIKVKEFQSTVQEILVKMQTFGITMKDLQLAKRSKTNKAKRVKIKLSKVSKKPVAAKYRGPNGEIWSGRGLTPKWLTALVAQGQSIETFAIHE